MSIAFISIGTNLGNRPENLIQAIHAIERTCGIVKQKSSIYETSAWGYQSFNNFLNQVVKIDTELSPTKLLAELLRVESDMGRQRSSPNYQDRIIDLDIITYDSLVLNETSLVLPHPHYHNRAFVLWPLSELEPNHLHPTKNKTAQSLKHDLAYDIEINIFNP